MRGAPRPCRCCQPLWKSSSPAAAARVNRLVAFESSPVLADGSHASLRGAKPIGLVAPFLQHRRFFHAAVATTPTSASSRPSISPPTAEWVTRAQNTGHQKQHVRGKKTKTSIRLEDLPQGAISVPLPPLEDPSEVKKKRIRKNKAKEADADDEGDGSRHEAVEAGEKRNKRKTTRRKSKQQDDEGGGYGAKGGEAADGNNPEYPTVVLQARRNMDKFENCVLLTRVGGFYELYFEHAEDYGPLLNLKVARKKTNAGPVSMAGFPFFQLERHLKTLVLDLNCYVAVAEEFRNSPGDQVKSGGLMHDRRVSRVITPGTLIDENFIDPYANNYVMAIYLNMGATSLTEGSATPSFALATDKENSNHLVPPSSSVDDAQIGLAWLDISTGQFYTQCTTVVALGSILSRVSPKEIVIDEVLESRRDHTLFSILAEDKHLITFAPQGGSSDGHGGDSEKKILPLSEWTPMLESDIPPATARAMTTDEIAAGSLLLGYVADRLQGLNGVIKLQPPLRHENLAVMAIDRTSMKSLEIRETLRDGGFRGSLLHAVRRTVTKGGARLLASRLSAPSTSLATIRERQDLVEFFVADADSRDHVVGLLRRSHDAARLVQKFAFGRGDGDDMLALASTIDATKEIVSVLEEGGDKEEDKSNGDRNQGRQDRSCFHNLLARIQLDGPTELADRIRTSIDEEGLYQQHQNEESEANELLTLAEGVVASDVADSSSSGGSSMDDGVDHESAAINLLPRASAAAATAAGAAAAEAAAEAEAEKTTRASSKMAAKKPPTSLRDHYNEDNLTFVMKPGASPGLSRLHAELSDLLAERTALGDSLRTRLDVSSLTLRWTPTLGHICHIKGAKDVRKISSSSSLGTTKDDDDENNNDLPKYTIISSSRTTRALHIPSWTDLGSRLHRIRFQIQSEESRIFAELRAAVVSELVRLRRNAAGLDELDVAASFARLVVERGGAAGGGAEQQPSRDDDDDITKTTAPTTSWVRPHLHAGTSHHIINGRHPTVEAGLREQGRTFTGNDCLVGYNPSTSSSSSSLSPSSSSSQPPPPQQQQQYGRVWLITGPNMAGKSTYLRQNALITILAQCGSRVPATFCSLGITDAVFSRVGAASGDDLYRDQSTFMVEMVEASRILRLATPRSLVVMDEVGRGTTPTDGEAVAYGVLDHLVRRNRCRALFATHFHRLADWAGVKGMMIIRGQEEENKKDVDPSVRGAVEAYCTDVEEDETTGGFVYVHRLRPGVNRRSHALKVARMAGLPEAAIAVAEEHLAASASAAGGDENGVSRS